MYDDYDWDPPYNKDEENWEQFRNEKMEPVYDLVDLLIKLKVLGPGFDVGLGGRDQTGEFVDRHWKV